MFRDPKNLRDLYAARKAADDAWHANLEKMLSGDVKARERMADLTQHFLIANEVYMAEASHFAKWVPKT